MSFLRFYVVFISINLNLTINHIEIKISLLVCCFPTQTRTLGCAIVASSTSFDDFSAKFMASYDYKIYKRLWNELRISKNLQTMLDYPWLVQPVIKIIANNKRFTELLSSMFTDIDLRKKLRNPMFYVRLLLNR